MKHGIRKLALVLVLALLLSTAALAADKATVTPVNNNVTLEFKDESQNNLRLTTQQTSNGMYLVLVLAGEEGDDGTPLVPTESNILYINQTTADSSGSVTFDNVYPSTIKDSTVYLSGTGLTGLTKMGFIDLLVMLGDVDGSGTVSAYDATKVLQYCAHIAGVEINIDAAKVNVGDQISAYNATLILQYVAHTITKFPAEG